MSEYTAKDFKKGPVGVRAAVTISFWHHCTKRWLNWE